MFVMILQTPFLELLSQFSVISLKLCKMLTLILKTSSLKTCIQILLLIILWPIAYSYRILIGLFLIFEGNIDIFQLKYFIKKILHATPSAFLNWNYSKLCMFAYYHVNICISLQQIDHTIFLKELLPFFTLNILSEK